MICLIFKSLSFSFWSRACPIAYLSTAHRAARASHHRAPLPLSWPPPHPPRTPPASKPDPQPAVRRVEGRSEMEE
eukprot:254321-Rhodomonas_salina.1